MKEKKTIRFITAFAIVLCAAAALLTGCSADYAVNKPTTETELATAELFSLFSGDEIGFSFQYPSDRAVAWSDADGAYIYGGAENEVPYVLVCKIPSVGTSPDSYFTECDRLMQETFQQVQSTPIQEVKLGEKTLYLVRYVCDGLVVDRYIELYPGFYIQYTSVSNENGSLDTELYYAITTLKVNEGAYKGAFSRNVEKHVHDQLAMSIDIPVMLDLKDLTIGYFASNDDAILLSLLITQDDFGDAIYNRQDFLDRAAESQAFVSGLLGVDSASFSEGEEGTLGGRSFYCYPMELLSGSEGYTGKLCLANADETGCLLLCYAVRNDSVEYDGTTELLEKCLSDVVYN